MTATSPCCFQREQVTYVAAEAPVTPGNWKPVVVGCGIAVVVTVLRFVSCPGAAPGTVVLYNGARDPHPASSSLALTAVDRSRPIQTVTREERDERAGGTRLDTLDNNDEMAGYASRRTRTPRLDRRRGFSVDVTLRVEAERHVRRDRAGISITVLAEDQRGIELGFWEDAVFAQDGGGPSTLFVHSEEAPIDTTTKTTWRVDIEGERYRVFADGRLVLTGPVRDYRAWTPPLPLFPDAYEQQSSVVISDNTTSAAARFVLHAIVVTTR
jgi:hypothetical protein